MPFSRDSFVSCFCEPFGQHFLSRVDENMPVRLSLAIDQVKWILQAVEEVKGFPWYHRDSLDSTSCCINGFISFLWHKPVKIIYSHADCPHCNASHAARTQPGDTGGLDTCKSAQFTTQLPSQLHVSLHKRFAKSLHRKI